jgi:hypothetical protein
MIKRAIILGFVSGLITSILTAANVYLFHVSWLWLVLYVVVPTAIAIGMTSFERRIGKYILYAYVFLFTQACIVGLFELPIYKYWVHYRTPAGALYSRYEMDAFYPILGLVFVLVLPVLISFPLLITNKARINVRKNERKEK